jgi:TRAP-type C4-dicarboxylate transport system substrate-binding protein
LRFDFGFGEGAELLVVAVDVDLHGGLRFCVLADSQLGDEKSMVKAVVKRRVSIILGKKFFP